MKKIYKIEIVEHTNFELLEYQNVLNTAMALAQSGFFINISKTDHGWYLLSVYIRKR